MFEKIYSKKGGTGTIIAYTVVLIPLIYVILLGFTWNLRDNTYDYIDTTLRTAVDTTTKRGVFDDKSKAFIEVKLDKIYSPSDYEVIIAKQDFADIGGNIPITKNIKNITHDISSHIKFNVGDVVYIQFKIIEEEKEPVVSRLIKVISSEGDMDKMLIIHQGMVEVNGE